MKKRTPPCDDQQVHCHAAWWEDDQIQYIHTNCFRSVH